MSRQTMMSDNLQIGSMDISALEQEIARIEQEEKNCLAELNELLVRENAAQGIFFAQEIHALKQDKLRLNVEKEFCRKRIARLRFEAEADYGVWQ
ncbi:MAG: hypothetical protein IJD04_06320 [Desulfovibrionaceae bacterium]|nr:hypothetical protein [Desulfovibrionaceae bacterium]